MSSKKEENEVNQTQPGIVRGHNKNIKASFNPIGNYSYSVKDRGSIGQWMLSVTNSGMPLAKSFRGLAIHHGWCIMGPVKVCT